ncbi:YodC family protein [Lysobacter zhanggongensis]|uniref:YodC family protein n=1 Tax=Lysobacter zhanggongensis TaxID=1774951 RepID=A0ABU7YMN6_9GAMM
MTKAAAFSVGDIVQLKSGGPEMTVQTAPDNAYGSYKCQWFAGKKLEAGHFPPDSLRSVTLEKK